MRTDDEDYIDITEEFKKNHGITDDEPAPAVEDKPAPEDDKPAPEDDKPAADDKPAGEGDEDWKKSDVFTDMEKMSHGFRKRIEKLNQKHQTEMDELRNSYEARLKAVEERTQPKPEVKTRDSFNSDEDYIDFLVKKGIDADREERTKAEQESAAKAEEEQKAAQEREAEIQKRQELFRKNTDDSFSAEDKQLFVAKVKYAMDHKFGDVLNANPAASDYLLGHRMGPRVMAHILDNPDEFKEVFMSEGQSQMDQYYTLKEIEKKVLAEGRGEEEEPQQPKSKFRLGKPGGQGSSVKGFNTKHDPKARRDFLEKLGVC